MKKQKQVILELYMEIWFCYEEGKSMAHPLFTTYDFQIAEEMCKERNYEITQIIDLELEENED